MIQNALSLPMVNIQPQQAPEATGEAVILVEDDEHYWVKPLSEYARGTSSESCGLCNQLRRVAKTNAQIIKGRMFPVPRLSHFDLDELRRMEDGLFGSWAADVNNAPELITLVYHQADKHHLCTHA